MMSEYFVPIHPIRQNSEFCWIHSSDVSALLTLYWEIQFDFTPAAPLHSPLIPGSIYATAEQNNGSTAAAASVSIHIIQLHMPGNSK